MNKLRKPFKSQTATRETSSVASPGASNSSYAAAGMSMVFAGDKPTISKTLQIASASLPTSHAVQTNIQQVDVRVASSAPVAVGPHTAAERYWAARALTAETVLKARIVHQQELRDSQLSAEDKHSREIAALVHANEARQNKLEKFVVALVGSVFLLFLAIVYILVCYAAHPPPRSTPYHFTIPILSPFASVVEHETGVIGAKTVTIFALVLGVLAYSIFRHWLTRVNR
ncbi:hypothetical protein BV22DRAFT_1039882 [Leucogyrophana mollusca]|uniref:Uncharacterized protein n=1 Tax=Leucogyrophana mollusca TaxID=85980 RepID=A0ACB8B4V3_9AGAM|nr:hypothetical protein BV22DRAFT_1039882 [Leucogyrophana mollusca]